MSLNKTNERTPVKRSQVKVLNQATALFCLLSSSFSAAALQEATIVPASAEEAPKPTELGDAKGSSASSPGTNVAAATIHSDADTYPSSFFDQFSPQNAKDMIDRLPGFSFDGGSDARGFGGTAGNVLIDGSRPTSKSSGLDDVLERIPAAQVLRIEVIRGGVSGGEAAGQSVVANVIRKQTGSSGTWTLVVRRDPDGEVRPNLKVALSSKLGAWDTSFDLDIGGNPDERTALVETRDAHGNLTLAELEDRPDGEWWLNTSGEASREFLDGKLTLNGRIGGRNWEAEVLREGYYGALHDSAPLDTRSFLDQSEKSREIELGADWTKTNGNDWRWRLITLGRIETLDAHDTYEREDFANDETFESDYILERKKSELIFRTTYGDAGSGNFRPELGFEIANNRMDNEIDYDENGEVVELDAADVVVDEIRGEGFATFVYQATDNLTIDGGLTFEASRIKVTGDANNSQSVSFWKPRLTTTYAFNEDVQLILEAERKVGQLNFNLFAANNNTQDDRSTGGNPHLKPDQKNRVAATMEWQYSKRGSIKAKYFHQWRKDILEEIILPSGSVGLGNAGDATYHGWEIVGNIPLDTVLKGGLLDIKYHQHYSNFRDPILRGVGRKVRWYTPNWLSFEFRQDITDAQFAWGVSYRGSYKDTGYFVDTIETFEGNTRFHLFAETTRFFGVKMRLEAFDVNTGKFIRSRFFYDEDRSGEFAGSEVAYRKRRPEFRLNISGTF